MYIDKKILERLRFYIIANLDLVTDIKEVDNLIKLIEFYFELLNKYNIVVGEE